MFKDEVTQAAHSARIADRLEIVFYTDPLCCWSRAVQLQLDRLKQDWADSLYVRYCMCGLIESWQHYHDAENAVYKPVQMGPLWMQAAHITGVPMKSIVWVADPPQSSYLACTAVKSVQLQDEEAGAVYFRMLQDALMDRGVNIARQTQLIEIAAGLNERFPAFDPERFKQDLVNGEGYRAFNADLAESRARNITRFPTLLISAGTAAGAIITGYKPYTAIIQTIEKLSGYDTGHPDT